MKTTRKIFPQKKIHLIGVGGIGLSRLARFFLLNGIRVTGSDICKNEIIENLQKLGLEFSLGHKAENIAQDTELVIYTLAVNPENPERLKAKERNIPEISHFQALGLISKQYTTIAVAGTNGKSTTTAMLGLILEAAGLDPLVFVGSVIREWNSNVRIGKGKIMVVEADELGRQFLSLTPQTIILTNIEPDHLDYYRNFQNFKSAFASFLTRLPPDGKLIYNADDPASKDIATQKKEKYLFSYGRAGDYAELISVTVKNKTQIAQIRVARHTKILRLRIPGEFNIYNALAALSCAATLGINVDLIIESLEKFAGIWRRFEIRGFNGKVPIISDYGHHPSAILGTMKAAREFYPYKKILLLYQPHQYKRTELLFEEFSDSFVKAHPDGLVLAEVFDVAGREDKDSKKVGSNQLLTKISSKLPNAVYAADLAEAEKIVRQKLPRYDLVIIMGAGDVDKVASNLIQAH